LPHEFDIPKRLADQGWRVKVLDKERAEPPHVTVTRGPRRWRFGIREDHFLDREPPAREVSKELLAWLRAHKDEFADVWDRKYPHNRVCGGEE
jgi:hypothetical protein